MDVTELRRIAFACFEGMRDQGLLSTFDPAGGNQHAHFAVATGPDLTKWMMRYWKRNERRVHVWGVDVVQFTHSALAQMTACGFLTRIDGDSATYDDDLLLTPPTDRHPTPAPAHDTNPHTERAAGGAAVPAAHYSTVPHARFKFNLHRLAPYQLHLHLHGVRRLPWRVGQRPVVRVAVNGLVVCEQALRPTNEKTDGALALDDEVCVAVRDPDRDEVQVALLEAGSLAPDALGVLVRVSSLTVISDDVTNPHQTQPQHHHQQQQHQQHQQQQQREGGENQLLQQQQGQQQQQQHQPHQVVEEEEEEEDSDSTRLRRKRSRSVVWYPLHDLSLASTPSDTKGEGPALGLVMFVQKQPGFGHKERLLADPNTRAWVLKAQLLECEGIECAKVDAETDREWALSAKVIVNGTVRETSPRPKCRTRKGVVWGGGGVVHLPSTLANIETDVVRIIICEQGQHDQIQRRIAALHLPLRRALQPRSSQESQWLALSSVERERWLNIFVPHTTTFHNGRVRLVLSLERADSTAQLKSARGTCARVWRRLVRKAELGTFSRGQRHALVGAGIVLTLALIVTPTTRPLLRILAAGPLAITRSAQATDPPSNNIHLCLFP